MSENNLNPENISAEEEAKLSKVARRRGGFKMHVSIFLLVNAFLWIVWAFLFKNSEDKTFFTAILFLLIVWLLALILHYLIAYKWTHTYQEKELSSLKKKREKHLKEIEDLKNELAEETENTTTSNVNSNQ